MSDNGSLFQEALRSSTEPAIRKNLPERRSTSASAGTGTTQPKKAVPDPKKIVKKPEERKSVKEMPIEYTKSAIGNSTKAMIAQQHSAAPPVHAPAPAPPAPRPKPSLAGLSFRKHPTKDQSASASTAARVDSAVPRTPDVPPGSAFSFTSDNEIVQSPVSMTGDSHSIAGSPTEIRCVGLSQSARLS